MYTASARINVSPLSPTVTFHHAFGSPFIVRDPVAAARAMVSTTGPTHHFSLVKWATKITVYDEDTRHVCADLRWAAEDTEGAMDWFRTVEGRVLEGRLVKVTFKGNW